MRILFTALIIPIAFIAYANTDPAPPLAPCVVNLGPDVTVCTNAEFTLNPHPDPIDTYSWAGGPGLSCYDCPSPQVSGLAPGIYTYIATASAPNCSASDTIRITVLAGESPQYEIAESRGICAGDSVALGGAAVPGTFYNWYSVPPGFGSTSANPKVKPASMTTYYLSASNSSCPVPVLDSVTLIPVTLNLQVTPADTIRLCQGKSRTFQATVTPAGQQVVWSPLSGLQVGANGTTAVATPLVSTQYTATASLGGCVRQRTIFVAVDSLPKNLKIIPADTTICQGEKVILNSGVYDPASFPKITFKWTPLSGSLTPDSLYNLAVQPSITTAYRRITRNGVCADTALAMVRVVPAAQMTVAPTDTSICPGFPVDLKLTFTPGVTDIKWSPAAGLSCTNCTNPKATPTATTSYTASGTFQGCPVSATATIQVRPVAPLKFPNDVQLCPGESVLLNETFDPSASYIWTSTHPGFGTVTTPNPTFMPTQTATYYVMTNNGCPRMDSIRIFVSHAILTVEGDTTICKNFSTPLTASANLQGTYQWRNETTGQIVGTMQVINVTPSMTTTYAAIFTYGDGCILTKPVIVTVSGEAPNIILPTDTRLCPGESVQLNTGPVLPGAVYTWTATPPDPGLLSASPTPVVSPGQNTSYSVMATLGNCTAVRQVNIITDKGSLSVSNDTTICGDVSLLLKATGTSDQPGSYTWNSGQPSAEINVEPLITTVYTVTYTYGDGCKLTDSIRVNVVESFDLMIACFPDTNEVDVGASINLTAIVNPPQNLSNFTFVWTETTVDTKPLPFSSESIDVVPSTNDTLDPAVTYTLIATSQKGCVRVAIKTIRIIFPEPVFPNAFTPNGDGTNDVFKMVVPKGLTFIDRMEIYNRWGKKIFESTAPDAVWDGTANGEPAPSDVYIYRIWWRRGDGALQPPVQGDVTLLR